MRIRSMWLDFEGDFTNMCDSELPVPAVDDNLRLPLAPAEKNNATIRKPRTRDISSRYKSGISSKQTSVPAVSRRSASPNAGRVSAAPEGAMPKRAQSAERRRPSTPPTSRHSAPSSPSCRPSTPSRPSTASTPSRPSTASTPVSPAKRPITPARDYVTEKSNYARRFSGRAADGLWPSVRSLSSSFQSESISVPVSKKGGLLTGNCSPDRAMKASANVNNERKRTPLRGRNASEQSENSRPVDNSHARVADQHRGPSIMSLKASANALGKSMDFTDKAIRSTSTQHLLRGNSPKRTLMSDGLGKSVDLTDKANRSVAFPSSVRGVSPRRTSSSDHAGRAVQRLINNGAERMSSDGSEGTASDVGLLANVPSKPSDRATSVGPSRTKSLPVSGFNRPSSPSRALTTQCFGRSRPSSPNRTLSSTIITRGSVSPSRTRPSTPFSYSGSTTTSSIPNYITDARKGKKNVNHLEDSHQLRLLYNRNLQWRFVNAKSVLVRSSQEITAENALYSVWNSMSQMRVAVVLKRMKLQHLKQEMRLNLILKEQIAYLEDWASLEREHCDCLSGAIEALKACTLRLPVMGGARADVLAVKSAVSSAVDVMQAMGSSVCHLLSKVEAIKCAASELSVLANKERAMLDECRELLASAAAMQVQESSLRTHFLQLRQDTTTLKQ